MAATDSQISIGARPRVLVADADAGSRGALRRTLESGGFEVAEAGDPDELQLELGRGPGLVLLDPGIDRVPAHELVESLRIHWPEVECVVVSGSTNVDTAVCCVRAGAFDYLEKRPRNSGYIVDRVRQALEHRRARLRTDIPGGSEARCATPNGVIFRSARMARLLSTVRNLAHNESNVLIEAESGAGKELLARAIHASSVRSKGPFVPLDCGALPEGIAEGELFGYERGAFTGAVRSVPGVFRSAHGGTLFLDEIGELSPFLQSKLLRVIQEREVRPLGSNRIVSVDVRIIAATHRDLASELRAGRFRADLFYRLRVVALTIPPLRERPEDIAVLATHFLERSKGTRVSGFEPDALEFLLTQSWEGNVRELQNVIEAAAALAPGPLLRASDLDLRAQQSSLIVPRPEGIGLSIREYERACLEEALRQSEGHVERAARLLQIGRSTLYRKLRNHGITPVAGAVQRR